MTILAYLLARFSEPSSYAGIGAVLVGLGFHFSDTVLGQLAIFFAAGCALLSVILKEKGIVRSLVLVVGLGLAATGLSACSALPGAGQIMQQLQSTATGKSLLAWIEGFLPGVNRVIAKANQDLGITPADVKMVCGGLSSADALFNLVAAVAPIPSEAVEAERAAMTGVDAVCAAQTQSAADLGTLVGDWNAIMTALHNAGITVAPKSGP